MCEFSTLVCVYQWSSHRCLFHIEFRTYNSVCLQTWLSISKPLNSTIVIVIHVVEFSDQNSQFYECIEKCSVWIVSPMLLLYSSSKTPYLISSAWLVEIFDLLLFLSMQQWWKSPIRHFNEYPTMYILEIPDTLIQ